MTDDIDRRLAALLAEPPLSPDPDFAARVVALAAYDLSIARKRKRAIAQVAIEALGLAAVLASFVLLARMVPESAGLGDAVPFGSPAMIGVALLGLWALVGSRPATA
jgi:hypothetical protein